MVASPLTPKSILYACRQLALRAGVSFSTDARTGFEKLGVPTFYGAPADAHFSSPGIIIRRCTDSAWAGILSAVPNSLVRKKTAQTIPVGASLPFQNDIPVLFWGDGCEDGKKPFAERSEDGSIIFHADILAAALFMLSRWEETTDPAALDKHGRFPSSASVALRQGFLEIPLIDQYGLILQAWLRALLPSWQPVKRKFSVKLSHDIDHVRRFDFPVQFIKSTGYEFLKKREFKAAVKTLVNGLTEQVSPRSAAQYQGILRLAKISTQNDMQSAFYFKASGRSAYDSGYHPEWEWVRSLILSLRRQGFEVGLHPGYQTFDNFEMLMAEKKRFDALLGTSAYGGRQHYLRFRAPQTWRFWEAAGFSYDSSVGYPDHEGFRCGTCLPYRPFDLTEDRELEISEIPLIVMDGTLAEYRRLTCEQGGMKILELAQRAREVGGVFTLLWHNTSLQDLPSQWTEIYSQAVSQLSAMQRNALPV